MEQSWGFVGPQGGGGILNVSSNEELDSIISEFPFGPWSETEIRALTDFERSLDNLIAAMRKMMPAIV